MKTPVIVAAIIFGVCAVYIVTHMALIEIGQEVVILHKKGSDGSINMTRLWIVDEGEHTWLHHGYPDSPWIRQLEANPIVRIERGGETREYRAVPEPTADPRVHRLLREKYGFADRLVRFWAGTDTYAGFTTRENCTAVPVRLELL